MHLVSKLDFNFRLRRGNTNNLLTQFYQVGSVSSKNDELKNVKRFKEIKGYLASSTEFSHHIKKIEVFFGFFFSNKCRF